MDKNSINAYDLPRRVASYDVDMDIMHPNRLKMIDIAIEILQFAVNLPITAIDLGAGTGFFTKRLLMQIPNAKVIAIDGSKSMIDLAKTRLGDFKKNVDFRIGDFRQLSKLINKKEKINIVFSSYALHHLKYDEKLKVIKEVYTLLQPGGWFINADIIVSDAPEIEKIIQKIRVNRIVQMAKGCDKRFNSFEKTQKFLSELEAKEGDKPITLTKDLEIIEKSGFKGLTLFWLEYREVVYGGYK